MLGAVIQQTLLNRQPVPRLSSVPQSFLGRQAEAIVKMTPPGLPGDILQRLKRCIGHEFSTNIRLCDPREIILQLHMPRVHRHHQLCLRLPLGQALPVFNLRIAPQHLEPRSDFMYAIVERLQLGRFIHHIFRAGDLAAIMQPGSNTERITLLLTHLKFSEGARAAIDRLIKQHLSQLRYTLAMACGVGRLGVDGIRQQLDDRLQQQLLTFK